MGYNPNILHLYVGYNPFTNHLLTSWDIRVVSGGARERSYDWTRQSCSYWKRIQVLWVTFFRWKTFRNNRWWSQLFSICTPVEAIQFDGFFVVEDMVLKPPN